MRKLIFFGLFVCALVVSKAQRINFPPGSGGGGSGVITNLNFNGNQFTVNGTNINIKSGAVITNLVINGYWLISGNTNQFSANGTNLTVNGNVIGGNSFWSSDGTTLIPDPAVQAVQVEHAGAVIRVLDADSSVSMNAADGFSNLQVQLNGSTLAYLDPSADLTGTPYFFNTKTTLGGNIAVIQNNGTETFANTSAGAIRTGGSTQDWKFIGAVACTNVQVIATQVLKFNVGGTNIYLQQVTPQ